MKYFDYLKKKLAVLNAAEDNRIAALSDKELVVELGGMSDEQLSTIVTRLSDKRLSGIANLLSASQLSRIMGGMSDTQLRHIRYFLRVTQLRDVLLYLSSAHINRVVTNLNNSQLAIVMEYLSDEQVSRIIGYLNDAQLDRVTNCLSGERQGIEIPVVADIDRKLLQASLDSSDMAGGVAPYRATQYITFAGDEGLVLEQRFGTHYAATMIYQASTGKQAPDFYCEDEVALADIKARVSNTVTYLSALGITV
jgi:hypothetical protein